MVYDPESGKFFWIVPKNGRDLTRPAGTVDVKGYRTITWQGQKIQMSRLAWVFQLNEWPEMDVGYKDGNPLNLRWSNLVLITKAEKQHNFREALKENTPEPIRVFKRATFSNKAVTRAVEEFIRGKTLIDGVYV